MFSKVSECLQTTLVIHNKLYLLNRFPLRQIPGFFLRSQNRQFFAISGNI